MDEINEQTENMKQIQEALSAPFGSAADFDEVTFPWTYLIIYSTKNPNLFQLILTVFLLAITG